MTWRKGVNAKTPGCLCIVLCGSFRVRFTLPTWSLNVMPHVLSFVNWESTSCKARNLSACLYFLHILRPTNPVYLIPGKFVAYGPRKCSAKFGAIWTWDMINSNTPTLWINSEHCSMQQRSATSALWIRMYANCRWAKTWSLSRDLMGKQT